MCAHFKHISFLFAVSLTWRGVVFLGRMLLQALNFSSPMRGDFRCMHCKSWNLHQAISGECLCLFEPRSTLSASFRNAGLFSLHFNYSWPGNLHFSCMYHSVIILKLIFLDRGIPFLMSKIFSVALSPVGRNNKDVYHKFFV